MDFRAVDNRISRAAQGWICQRSVGIYLRRPPEWRPVFEGTGVLLQIANVGVLVSAAHVMKSAQDALFEVGPMTDGARPIFIDSPIHVSIYDILDVGFVRLSEEVMRELGACGKRFVRLNEVALVTEPLVGLYNVLGYPQFANRPDYETKRIDAMPFCYGTYLCVEPPDSYKGGVSIAVKWTSEMIKMPNGEAGRMPYLQGISGCGMWCLYRMEDRNRLDEWDPSWIRLSGIEHRVSTPRKKWMMGTLMWCVIALLKQHYPDLRRSIELTMPA